MKNKKWSKKSENKMGVEGPEEELGGLLGLFLWDEGADEEEEDEGARERRPQW